MPSSRFIHRIRISRLWRAVVLGMFAFGAVSAATWMMPLGPARAFAAYQHCDVTTTTSWGRQFFLVIRDSRQLEVIQKAFDAVTNDLEQIIASQGQQGQVSGTFSVRVSESPELVQANPQSPAYELNDPRLLALLPRWACPRPSHLPEGSACFAVHGFGWPLIAFRSIYVISPALKHGITGYGDLTWVDGAASPGLDLAGRRPVPFDIVWTNAAVNLIAAICCMYIVTAASRTLVQRYRLVNRKCPACGYDMSALGNGRCPECGRPGAASRSDLP